MKLFLLLCLILSFYSTDTILGQELTDYWCMKKGQKIIMDLYSYTGATLIQKESMSIKILENVGSKDRIRQKIEYQFYLYTNDGMKSDGEINAYYEITPTEINYIAYQYLDEEVKNEEYPLIDLKYPIKKGNSWHTMYQHFPINREFNRLIKLDLTVMITDTNLTVTTPACTFINCIKKIEKCRTDSLFLIHDSTGKETLAHLNYQRTEWWAKDLGCIKAEVDERYEKVDDNNKIAIEFKKYYKLREIIN